MSPELHNLGDKYFRLMGISEGLNLKDSAHSALFRRVSRDLSTILKMANNDQNIAAEKMQNVSDWAESHGLEWSLSTVIRRWFLDGKEKVVATKMPDMFIVEDTKRDSGIINSGLENIKDLMKKKGI